MLDMEEKYEWEYKQGAAAPPAFDYAAPAMLKLLTPGTDLNILEIGCGAGYMSHLMSTLGHKVTGVDASTTGIENAKTQYPGCRFIKADIRDFPFDEVGGSFDVVLSMEVIEHLIYPSELMRIAGKCLKPKGRLILSTPYHGYLKNLIMSLSGRWDRHFDVHNTRGHLRFFSKKTLKAMLEKEGFENIRFKGTGRTAYLWKSMVCDCRKS